MPDIENMRIYNIYIDHHGLIDVWGVIISRQIYFKCYKICCKKCDIVMSALTENNGKAAMICPAGVNLRSL